MRAHLLDGGVVAPRCVRQQLGQRTLGVNPTEAACTNTTNCRAPSLSTPKSGDTPRASGRRAVPLPSRFVRACARDGQGESWACHACSPVNSGGPCRQDATSAAGVLPFPVGQRHVVDHRVRWLPRRTCKKLSRSLLSVVSNKQTNRCPARCNNRSGLDGEQRCRPCRCRKTPPTPPPAFRLLLVEVVFVFRQDTVQLARRDVNAVLQQLLEQQRLGDSRLMVLVQNVGDQARPKVPLRPAGLPEETPPTPNRLRANHNGYADTWYCRS